MQRAKRKKFCVFIVFFAETQFGPEPQPLMELLAERGLAPVVICESAGTQAEDACTMQQMYRAARDLRKIL